MTDPPGDAAVIELRIARPEALFASLDPSPFRERDLDPQAEAFILDWARELPARAALRLRLHLPPEEAARASAADLEAAVRGYFASRRAAAETALREHFRLAWRYLAVGLPLLALCLGLSRLVAAGLGDGTAARILQESLVIAGWVANWRPIEAFLYDWWPIRRRIALLDRLERAGLEIARPRGRPRPLSPGGGR